MSSVQPTLSSLLQEHLPFARHPLVQQYLLPEFPSELPLHLFASKAIPPAPVQSSSKSAPMLVVDTNTVRPVEPVACQIVEKRLVQALEGKAYNASSSTLKLTPHLALKQPPLRTRPAESLPPPPLVAPAPIAPRPPEQAPVAKRSIAELIPAAVPEPSPTAKKQKLAPVPEEKKKKKKEEEEEKEEDPIVDSELSEQEDAISDSEEEESEGDEDSVEDEDSSDDEDAVVAVPPPKRRKEPVQPAKPGARRTKPVVRFADEYAQDAIDAEMAEDAELLARQPKARGAAAGGKVASIEPTRSTAKKSAVPKVVIPLPKASQVPDIPFSQFVTSSGIAIEQYSQIFPVFCKVWNEAARYAALHHFPEKYSPAVLAKLADALQEGPEFERLIAEQAGITLSTPLHAPPAEAGPAARLVYTHSCCVRAVWAYTQLSLRWDGATEPGSRRTLVLSKPRAEQTVFTEAHCSIRVTEKEQSALLCVCYALHPWHWLKLYMQRMARQVACIRPELKDADALARQLQKAQTLCAELFADWLNMVTVSQVPILNL